MNKEFEITNLQLPKIDKQTFKRAYIGIRPFRQTGIRREKEIIGDKAIFHHYGHGGSGISLAPATALQIVEMVSKETIQEKKIAILGAGIAGLSTAYFLAKKGYDITIYAKVIPDKDNIKEDKECTSQMAPGYWLPSFYYSIDNSKQHQKQSFAAFEVFKSWMQTIKGISYCDVYEEMTDEEFKKRVPKFLWNTGKRMNIKFARNTDKFKEVMRFRTLKINLKVFLSQLIKECKYIGVKFEEYNISGILDILKLQENYIVNCLGFANKKIFGDSKIYGIKGHLLEFENTYRIPQFICMKFNNSNVHFYCHDDKLFVGQSSEENETYDMNEQTIQKIYNNAINFIQEYQGSQPQPRL